eukprot:2553554-Prymnesium_polylepis.1
MSSSAAAAVSRMGVAIKRSTMRLPLSVTNGLASASEPGIAQPAIRGRAQGSRVGCVREGGRGEADGPHAGGPVCRGRGVRRDHHRGAFEVARTCARARIQGWRRAPGRPAGATP